MKRKKITVGKSTIAKYWAKQISDIKKVPEHEINEAQRCFACMLALPLQRAHITPYTDPESNSVDNLHLLCQTCHRDSETLLDDNYWDWLKQRTTLDTIVSMAEFEGKSIENLSKLFAIAHKAWKKDCSHKTKLALQKRKELGLAYTNIPPYGKMRSKDGKCFIDNPYEIKIINKVIGYREKGHGLRKIAKIMNENGLTTRKGTPWSIGSVRTIVWNNRPDLKGRVGTPKKS